jgi:cell division protein FtsQ
VRAVPHPATVVDPGPLRKARARADRRARWRRALRRAGWAVVAAVPLVVLGWLLLASPWLKVDAVEVTGTSRLTDERVALAAGVPAGTPLARVDTGAVERRVKRLPAVDQVEVTRSWPSTLVVTVTERHAVVGVLEGRSWTLVDADGVAFGTASALPPGAVRLQVRSLGPDDPATRAALAVLAELPPALRAQVVVVRAASDVAVSLQVRGGRTVVWGAPGDAATKAAAAAALLKGPTRVVDVSSPGVATTR